VEYAEVLAAHAHALEGYGDRIDRTIAEGDDMFRGNPSAYFDVGRSALVSVTAALSLAGKTDANPILDLPCGHGRVLRFLRVRFPSARIVACDIGRNGVDFCAEQFGAVPVYSTPHPRDIPIDESFALIWVGSLLTHVNVPLWHEFLDFFIDRLEDGGVLLFSVLGRFPALRSGRHATIQRRYAARGFAFVEDPTTPGLGTTAAAPAWVVEAVQRREDVRLLVYWERGWNDHQDVVALEKSSAHSPFAGPRLL
jgi:SAM-dependent methyltransferase